MKRENFYLSDLQQRLRKFKVTSQPSYFKDERKI